MKPYVKKAVAMLALAVTATASLLVFGAVASAAPPPPVTDDIDKTTTFVIAAPIVTFITSVVIPVVTGYLTKSTWSGTVKAWIMIVLNAASALIVNGMLVDGGSAFSTQTLYTAVIGCLVSGFMFHNMYVPAKLTSRPGDKLATVGVK